MNPLVSPAPGLVLLYKGVDALGNVIDYFEHGGLCHAALTYDATQLIRQNPGGVANELLSAAPWGQIQAMRLCLTPLAGQSGTPPLALATLENPHTDTRFKSAFPIVCANHKGDEYGYLAIDEFMKEGQLQDLGLAAVAAKLRGAQVPFFNDHREVCSAFDVIVLEETIQMAFNWPTFKLDPRTPESQERPIDLPNIALLTAV